MPTGGPIRRHAIVLAAALAALALPAAGAAGQPALAGPPGALLRAAPVELSPGPPNGDLAQGLASQDGPAGEAPEPLGRGVRLRANVTLVSPPLAVPVGAQTLAITARAPTSGALLEVLARPAEGGADIPLGTLEPGPAPLRQAVGIAAVAGRAVSIVLDPTLALGTTVDVLRVGPVTAPLPGWTVTAGALDVAGPRGQRAVQAADPLELASPAFRPGGGARALLVAVRGDGVLRASAGGRRVAAQATGVWRDVVVPLRSRSLATLRLDARPGGGRLELRDLGLVRRTTRAVALRARRAGGRVRVQALLVPAGGRLEAELRDARGRRIARGRSDAAGRLRLRGAGSGRITLVVAGDRTRIGLRTRV